MTETEREKRMKARQARQARVAKASTSKVKKKMTQDKKAPTKKQATISKSCPSTEETKKPPPKFSVPIDIADAVNDLISGASPARVSNDLLNQNSPASIESRIGRYLSPRNNLEVESASVMIDSTRRSVPPKKRLSPKFLAEEQMESKHTPRTSNRKRRPSMKRRMEEEQLAEKKQRQEERKESKTILGTENSSKARANEPRLNEVGVTPQKHAVVQPETRSMQPGNVVSSHESAISPLASGVSQPKRATTPPKSVVILPKNEDSPLESDTSLSTTLGFKSKTEKEIVTENKLPIADSNNNSFDTDDSSWRIGKRREDQGAAREKINLYDSADDQIENADDDELNFKLENYCIQSDLNTQGNTWLTYSSLLNNLQIHWIPGASKHKILDFEASLGSHSNAFHCSGVHDIGSTVSFGNFVYMTIPVNCVQKCSRKDIAEVNLLLSIQNEVALRRLANYIGSKSITPKSIEFRNIIAPLAAYHRKIGKANAKLKESKFTSSKQHGEVILEYPFPTEPNNINSALEILPELKMGTCFNRDDRSSITVSADDYTTLNKGEKLTDSIINLWMLLLTRKQNDDVHIFSSLFFTDISGRMGARAGLKWIKNIDIFKKQLILIPVNSHDHWSILAVINLRGIFNDDDGRSPTFLHLDSLGLHHSNSLAKAVVDWIKQVLEKANQTIPDLEKSFFRISPKVSKQTNGVDCGVFVCLYAYAILVARTELIEYPVYSRGVQGLHEIFRMGTATGNAFHFDDADIIRVREGFQRAIEVLHTFYNPDLGGEGTHLGGVSHCNEKNDDESRNPSYASKNDDARRDNFPSAPGDTSDSRRELMLVKKENFSDNSSFNKEEFDAFMRLQASKKVKQASAGPVKPRKANTYYFMEQRPVLKAKHPNKDSKFIQTILARNWRQLDPSAKYKYKLMAEQDKGRYEREVKEVIEDNFERKVDKPEIQTPKEQVLTKHHSSKHHQRTDSTPDRRMQSKSVRIRESAVVTSMNESEHLCAEQPPINQTNYLPTDVVGFQRARALNCDLDGIFSSHEWNAMSDIERVQHMKTRLASAHSHTLCSTHPKAAATPPHSTPSTTQNFTAPHLRQEEHTYRSNPYITHYSDTPSRDIMLKRTIGTSRAQIKSKNIVNGAMAANSLKGEKPPLEVKSKPKGVVKNEIVNKSKSFTNGDTLANSSKAEGASERHNACKVSDRCWEKVGIRELKQECQRRNLDTHGNKKGLIELLEIHDKESGDRKQSGSVPTRVEQVFKKDNRRLIKRAADSLVQRCQTQLKCKKNWPQAFQILGQYNEITRNDSGKASTSSKFRKRPQWTFLVPDEQHLKLFKEEVCPKIDTNRYDVHFTTCPDKFTDRLAEDEDGNGLSAGAPTDIESAFEKLRKKKVAQILQKKKEREAKKS